MDDSTHPTFAIGRDDAGQRLDRFLRKLLPSATLGHVFKLLRTGKARVNGRKSGPDQRLADGDVVELRLSGPQLESLRARRAGARSAPEARSREALVVLHRDDDVLAVDKPPMLLSQSGDNPDEPTLERLVAELAPAGGAHTFRASIAHRLDRGTSGLVLAGRSAPGLRGLTEAFRARTVTKHYLALVVGAPQHEEFVVDAPLLRESAAGRRGAHVRVSRGSGAKSATTEFRVRACSADGAFSLVAARPHTGRTHQIRAHLRHAKLPIVGDPVYGDRGTNGRFRDRAGLWRQFLHAWRIELDHPTRSGEQLRVTSPLPPDLLRTLSEAEVMLPEDLQ